MRRPSGLPRWTRHSKRASQGAPSTHRSGSGRSPALPGYFADRYGFSVVGTVIPGVGTGETPTAKQLSDLTTAIRTSGARAIFVEIEENPKLAEQIAAETGITVVDDLLDHSLSAADGVAPTYIALMRYDTRRIVEALR